MICKSLGGVWELWYFLRRLFGRVTAVYMSCSGCLQLPQLCFLMRCQNNWKVSCVASHMIREWSNNLSVRMLRVFDTYRYWISIVQFYIVWLCVDIEHWCFIMYDLFKILPLIWWAVIVIDLVFLNVNCQPKFFFFKPLITLL